MNKSAVRRALTTLKKQQVVYSVSVIDRDEERKPPIAEFVIKVDAELIQPKKKVYIKKSRTKKDATRS